MYPNYGSYSNSNQPHRVEIDLRQTKGEHTMGSEKVDVHNIFTGVPSGGGGHEGGIGGLGTAAAIAAMGNRNESGNSIGALAPLLLGRNNDGFGGGGFGMGLIGGVIGGALFGGRRGGLFGGGDGGDCGGNGVDVIGQQIILGKLGSIEAAVPLSALQVQNAIQEQTIGLNSGLSALALGTQQGFANTKDAVQVATVGLGVAIAGAKDATQNGLFLLSNQVQEGICQVKTAIATDGALTRSQLSNRWSQEDQTKIATQAAEIIELRNEDRNRSRHASLELQITNTNTAVAAQAQAQGQFQVQRQGEELAHLSRCFSSLANDFQIARATNSNVIVGSTGVATGAQTSAPTNVRA